MIPVSDLDNAIINRVSPKKSRKEYNATIGILFIEPGNRDFFEYINYYNRASGNKIDFFIPGYRYNEYTYGSLKDDLLMRDLHELADCYDSKLYKEAVEEVRLKLGLDVDKNQYPKLIMTDVRIDYSVDRVFYGNRFMIDLGQYATNFEPVFSKIFDYAEKRLPIRTMKARYIAGRNANNIIECLREFTREIVIDIVEGKIIGM